MSETISEESSMNIINIATKNQQTASDPNFSVWVEASAGTGKTKVLTDRVLRLLLQGVNPSKILCLTYTKAAAANMRDRISAKLSRWAVVGDNELLKDLENVCGADFISEKDVEEHCSKARKLFAKFLDESDNIKIQTIHSFCEEILKRFPLEAKVSPYFEIIEDRKSKEILEKIKREILLNCTKNEVTTAIKYLVEKVSESTFPKILKNITDKRVEIEEFLQKYACFEDMQYDLATSLNIKVTDTDDTLKDDFLVNTDFAAFPRMIEILRHGKVNDNKFADIIYKFLQNRDAVEDYTKAFFKSNGETKEVSKDAICYDESILEFIASEAKRISVYKNKLLNLHIFLATSAVLRVAIEIIRAYNEFKQNSSQMDFGDLVIITRNMLKNKGISDWVMYKLDEGIDHILIDEAQDNSAVQWEIIQSLSSEFFAGEGAKKNKRTVFAVGDRKQSIYGFNGANPDKFESMREYFSAKSKDFKTVSMNVSFRSSPAIIDVVNTVFKSEKSKNGVVSSGQEVESFPSHTSWKGRVEIWKIIENESKVAKNQPDDSDFSKITESSELVKQLAIKIKSIVDNKEFLASKNRPAKYRDFMILVKTRTGRLLPELLHEFQNMEIPTYGADRINLLDQIAIQDLISLGKFLLLPTDDISLAEALKSPIFNLDDDDLIKLCTKRGDKTIFKMLSGHSEYADVYSCLCVLLQKVDFLRPYELYTYILNKMNGKKNFVQRMGIEVEDGLNEFVNLTLSFEKDHIPSLQEFIAWIEEDDVKIKRDLDESLFDAVKIMTVHSSKGLQAPIVILPDVTSIPSNTKGLDILFDDMIYVPLASCCYNQNCLDVHEKNHQKEMQEYRRLLYVAMTRAEDRLCICANKKGDENSWYQLCEESMQAFKNDDQDMIVYETAGENNEISVEDTSEENIKNSIDFSWLKTDAPLESPLAKPYHPSTGSDDEIALSPLTQNAGYQYKRGSLMHKILQFIPNIDTEKREEKMFEFLQKNASEMSTNERCSIITEILQLLNNEDLKFIFDKEAKSEVAIMGEVDGKIISAQIDRLAINKDRVVVVDYKTNRPAAQNFNDVPKIYKSQMDLYYKLLQQIYPQKKIEVYILWTNTAKLMKII